MRATALLNAQAEDVPDLAAVFAGNQAALAHMRPAEGVHVFHNVCDSESRKKLIELLGGETKAESYGLGASVGLCILTRSALEPLFRKWLSPASTGSTKP